MKRAILFLLVMQLTIPSFASDMTVDKLSKIVASSRGKKDAKVAERLYGMELTERLSAAKLAALEAALPGPESRRALVALADLATFFDPPQAEIPNLSAPTLEQQREITEKAIDYVKTTLHRLPNLFARRDTISFEDTPPVLRSGGGIAAASGVFIPAKPMHPVSRSTETVLFREGQEKVQKAGEEQETSESDKAGLTTFGEFGPILSTIFGDLPRGDLAWSHWEKIGAKPVAVFRFGVPANASHYQIKFCCIAGKVFEKFPAYHGTVTIDPATGTILRLTLITDFKKSDPIAKAELMVEYGQVELGRQKYYCPVRSISVSLAPVESNTNRAKPLPGYVPTINGNMQLTVQDYSAEDAPLQTMLNEVIFDQYHLFQSESRLVIANSNTPGGTTEGAANALLAAPGLTPPNSADPEKVVSAQAAPTAATADAVANTATNAGAAPEVRGSVVAGPAQVPAVVVSAIPRLPSTNPEMSIATAGNFPGAAPDSRGEANQPKFSLHVSTRLVDIGVTAQDRRGRPITDLLRDDFVVYDNGKKQNLRSFSSASTIDVGTTAPVPMAGVTSYSNRPDAMASAPAAGEMTAQRSTVVLLDATSLSFADLNNAREQIQKFLDKLPPTEPVALYVRAGAGFRVLAEATSSHREVSAALKVWKPQAQDMAHAQEAEMRNRQQFDTVQSAGDMQYVNGNVAGAAIISSVMDIPGGGSSTTPDPKMMKEGSDPVRQALMALAAVAVHMGAISGNKNLVWVASDNVLADWSDKAVGVDRSGGGVGNFGIRVQEALNDAHVSLYPMDASQLETGATDASLQNASVQLDPGSRDANGGASMGDATARPGARMTAAMQQDLHPVQGGVVRMAEATGGKVFQRSSGITSSLHRVIDGSRAEYRLSFAPDTAPDDQYHKLTVEVPGRHGITLRYRAGYLYSKEPTTLQERFKGTIWQPQDASEIALSAHRTFASGGAAISLEISAPDVGLELKDDRWVGMLDIFLVQRDETGLRAAVKGQTLSLNLTSATYQKVMKNGIPFEQYIDSKQEAGTVRIIVVDERSGRIGSITLPAVSGSVKAAVSENAKP